MYRFTLIVLSMSLWVGSAFAAERKPNAGSIWCHPLIRNDLLAHGGDKFVGGTNCAVITISPAPHDPKFRRLALRIVQFLTTNFQSRSPTHTKLPGISSAWKISAAHSLASIRAYQKCVDEPYRSHRGYSLSPTSWLL